VSWPSRSIQGVVDGTGSATGSRRLLYRLILEGSSIPGGWLTITVLAIVVLVAFIVAVRDRQTHDADQPGWRRRIVRHS